MTDTPTAKELFLALWQVRMGAHATVQHTKDCSYGRCDLGDDDDEVGMFHFVYDNEHTSKDFDDFWIEDWDDCVRLAAAIARDGKSPKANKDHIRRRDLEAKLAVLEKQVDKLNDELDRLETHADNEDD